MQDLTEYWKLHLYIEPLMCVVLLITLVVSYTNRKKFPILKYIPLYAGNLLIVSMMGFIYQVNGIINFVYVGDFLDYCFTFFELAVFSRFFYVLLSNRMVKKIILPMYLLFFIFGVIMLLRDDNSYLAISEKTQRVVYTIEGILLLILSTLYLFEFYQKPKNLAHDPTFWVTSGLFIFLVSTLPFSIIENFLSEYYSSLLYPIFYTFYILFFLMIIKAYLCPYPISEPKDTTKMKEKKPNFDENGQEFTIINSSSTNL